MLFQGISCLESELPRQGKNRESKFRVIFRQAGGQTKHKVWCEDWCKLVGGGGFGPPINGGK